MKSSSRFKNFFLVLKATRVKRAGFALLSIFAAASFVNLLNRDVIILAILALLLYCVGGLHNAKVDNDYRLKKRDFYIAVSFILFISLILASTNPKILVLISLVLVLTIFYNTISRKLLYVDLFILSLTHVFVPFIGTLWLLNKNIMQYIGHALMPTLTFIFIVSVKNILEFEKDRKRGYVTLMTLFKNGKGLMKASVAVGLLILSLFFLILGFSLVNLIIFSLIFFISIFIIKYINNLEGKKAIILARMLFTLVLMIYLIENRASLTINMLFFILGYVFIKDGLIIMVNDLKGLKNYKLPT
jgi:hypothetical protein